MPKPAAGTGETLVPSKRSRTALVRRFSAHTGTMTTAVVSEIEARHPWYGELSASERSWINVVASNGIKQFAEWFVGGTAAIDPIDIFSAAPRELTRTIRLRQTVDLIRTTTDVVGAQIGQLMSRGDRQILQTAVLYYSRDVAFASAEVYARAAEQRVSWDERIETVIIDQVVRGETQHDLVSRASTLSWDATAPVFVAVGTVPDADIDKLRLEAERLGVPAMVAIHGERLIAILAATLTKDFEPHPVIEALAPHFGHGPIVIGSIAENLAAATVSAQAAIAGADAAFGWIGCPKIVDARQLLPERTLAGDPAAKEELISAIYVPLADAGGDLLETVISFLDHSHSVEASARDLYVHPNTVRYRLKRVGEVTGYLPSESRDAYTLRLAITLGNLGRRAL